MKLGKDLAPCGAAMRARQSGVGGGGVRGRASGVLQERTSRTPELRRRAACRARGVPGAHRRVPCLCWGDAVVPTGSRLSSQARGATDPRVCATGFSAACRATAHARWPPPTSRPQTRSHGVARSARGFGRRRPDREKQQSGRRKNEQSLWESEKRKMTDFSERPRLFTR